MIWSSFLVGGMSFLLSRVKPQNCSFKSRSCRCAISLLFLILFQIPCFYAYHSFYSVAFTKWLLILLHNICIIESFLKTWMYKGNMICYYKLHSLNSLSPIGKSFYLGSKKGRLTLT